MSDFDPLDDGVLLGLDELALEQKRYELVLNADDRRSILIEHLVIRGADVIVRVARERADAAGLSHEQLMTAVEEATVTLEMRLRRPAHLGSITSLASTIATDAVNALQPAPADPPQLTSAPPKLRVVDQQIGDALGRGEVRRNDWSSS
jgi:hypothetical protein